MKPKKTGKCVYIWFDDSINTKKSPAGTDEANEGILNLFGKKIFLTIGKYAQGVI